MLIIHLHYHLFIFSQTIPSIHVTCLQTLAPCWAQDQVCTLCLDIQGLSGCASTFSWTLSLLVLPWCHRGSAPVAQTCQCPDSRLCLSLLFSLTFHLTPSGPQLPFQGSIHPLYPLTAELLWAELVSTLTFVWRKNCERNVYESLAVASA